MANSRKILHCFLLILHFPLHGSIDTLNPNQPFKQGDLLVSRNNKFAFGFFSPGISNNTYLGIWFHKISELSVVWVANRNSPIKSSSGFLSVTEDGNIAIYNNPDKKFMVWSTNVSGEASNPCYVHLLDSGNLALVRRTNGRIVWQSFDHPTDTRLPGTKLGRNTKTGLEWSLTSWKSADDPGIGEFSIRIDSRALQIFLYKQSRILWRGYLWPVRNFSNLYSYKVSVDEEEVNTVYYINDDSILNRQIVDHNGMFRWLRWSEIDGKWKEFWSVPVHPCEVYAHCGVNGKCSSSNSDMFLCSCLPGYEPRSPGEWYLRDASGGCKRKREESSGACRKGDGFLKVEDAKFPDTGFLEAGDVGFQASSSVALLHTNVSRVECELECLRNCSCSAYASVESDGENGFGCLTWYGELVDTLDRVGSGIDLYVRVDAIELAENTEPSNLFLGMGIEVLVLSVVSVWVTILIIVYLLIRRKKRVKKQKAEKRIFDPAMGSIYYKNTLVASELRQSNSLKDLPFFDFGTIVAATDNFSAANKLGQGGFGIVYKGELYDGQEVAVKRLSENSGQGIEEFKNEVMLIAKLQHKNLVKLLGCCIDKEERILVYEYMPNKSLDSFLFDQTRRSLLDWRKRIDIITGIARGILYLHQDSRLPIIHRDLKCSNVLLDANMNPKISDFGMARIFKHDQIQEKTRRVVGTYGYMSPEYALFGKFSVKSDVFGFGIILLEIITGKKNSGFQEEDTNCSTLIGYVWELWRQGKVREIVDFSMEEGSYNLNEVLRYIQIGLLCVEENAVDRPNISEVILMLSSEMSLPFPKQPAFHYRISQAGKIGSNSMNDVTITAFFAR